MKFGHNLPRNQVPEWASSYINYKGLKKLVKNAAEASKNGAELDLAGKFRLSKLFHDALVKPFLVGRIYPTSSCRHGAPCLFAKARHSGHQARH